jgi:two-component system, response regulator / RNA-binding antiterminator
MRTSTPDERPQNSDLASAHLEISQLRTAMETRSVIDQAKGILMAVHGCSADKAFQLLSTASQRDNRKLNEIAASIVANVQTGEDERSTG